MIPWRVEPKGVLYALARDVPVPGDLPEGAYEVVVSPGLPGMFHIRLMQGDAP